MAVSIVIAKQALDAGENSVQATLLRMLAGTGGAVLLGIVTGQKLGEFRPVFAPEFAGLFLLSVAVVTFGGFWLALFAVQQAGVAIASTLGLARAGAGAAGGGHDAAGADHRADHGR